MSDSHASICDIYNRVIDTDRQMKTKFSLYCGKLKTVQIKCAQTYFAFTNSGETFKIE